MSTEHWWLLIFWTLFSVMHSLLASGWWKRLLLKLFPGELRYYRLVYSVVAFVSLALILYYQYSISSERMWEENLLVFLAAFPLLLVGLWIMGVSIRKYFLFLSGIDVLIDKKIEGGLQKEGLHRFVRHPLYLGTLLVVWSLFLVFPYLNNLIACASITVYTLVGIQFEEQKLVKEFGNSYKKYRQDVPMLLPRLKKSVV